MKELEKFISTLETGLSNSIVKAKAKEAGLTQTKTLAEYKRQVEIRTLRSIARRTRFKETLQQRLFNHLIRLADEAANQQTIAANLRPRDGKVIDREIQDRLWLIKASEKVHYSNRFGDWWNNAVWLSGYDDGHIFCVRVPSTMMSVKQAIEWMKPADVKRAEKSGKQVIRQGDIYFVESKCFDLSELEGSRHQATSKAKGLFVIEHPEHRPVVLAQPMKAMVGKRVSGGRSGRKYD